MLSLIISLISGAAGGNIIGKLASGLSTGGMGNTILGALGGAGGGSILSMLSGGAVDPAAASGAMDIGSLIQTVGLGAAGGGALTGVGGILKGILGR